jgi:hypothetical protein
MMLSKVMMKLVMDDGRDRRFMQPAHNDESDPRLFQTGVRTSPPRFMQLAHSLTPIGPSLQYVQFHAACSRYLMLGIKSKI